MAVRLYGAYLRESDASGSLFKFKAVISLIGSCGFFYAQKLPNTFRNLGTYNYY